MPHLAGSKKRSVIIIVRIDNRHSFSGDKVGANKENIIA